MEYPSHFLRGHLRKMTFMDCWLHTAYEQNLKKKVKLEKKCFKSNYEWMRSHTHVFLWEVLTFDNQNELSAMGLKIQLQSWSQKKISFSLIFTTQPLQFDEFSKVNSRSICELTKYHFYHVYRIWGSSSKLRTWSSTYLFFRFFTDNYQFDLNAFRSLSKIWGPSKIQLRCSINYS